MSRRLVVVVVAFVLAACGGSNPTFSGPPGSTSGTSTTGSTSAGTTTSSSTTSASGATTTGASSGSGAGSTSSTSSGSSAGSTSSTSSTSSGSASSGGSTSSATTTSSGSGTTSSTTTSGGSTGATTSGGSTSTGGSVCGTCPSTDVCCSSGPCTGQCVPDCRLGGSCPTGNTCDTSSGLCLPSGSSSTGGSTTTTSGGSTTGGACGGGCPSTDVCCSSGPCTGQCVPDCRQAGGCPSGNTCDTSSGLCLPSGSSSTGGSTTTTTSGGSTTGGACGGGCPSTDVCCSSGPCTGQCVPDCRLGGSCPSGNTCDASTGLCKPSGSSSTTGGSTTGGSTTTSGGTTSGGGTTGAGCSTNTDCPLPTGVCDADAGACVECMSDGDCGGSPFTCETASETCWRASCDLTAHTEPSGKVNSKGCDELLRDTTPCMAQRLDAGISGPWLAFSCLVTLKMTTTPQGKKAVEAISTGMPDHKSVYFDGGSPCYETDTTRSYADPNLIASRNVDMVFEYNPTETNGGDSGFVATMGLAVDGVQILNDSAGPNTNIYTEVGSFDRCGAHPQSSGAYHYHTEPYAITQDDDALVGVARDGYFIYGRRDPDGSEAGAPDGGVTGPYFGHVGATIDSATPVFHYHVHYEQDGGASAYFVGPWQFYGRMGSCPSGCN